MSRRAVLPLLLLAAALAGCGGAPDPGHSSEPAPSDRLTAPAQTVLVANSTAKFGTVVIDAEGWTLYRSDADAVNTSACSGSCVDEWPPVLMQPGRPDVEGLDPKLVGSITREDGAQQVTIGGWPVYRHATDSKPGNVDGQGVDGSWWAVTPTGGKAGPS